MAAAHFDGLLPPAAGSEKTSNVRACTNCVRAKAKCLKTSGIDGAGTCERCHRMKKICQASPPVRRARTLKKLSADKTSQIEEKLDGLVTLLKSAATQNTPGILNTAFMNSSLEGLQSAMPETSSVPTSTSSVYGGQYTRSATGEGLPNSIYTPAPSISSKSTPYSNHSLEPVVRPDFEPSPEEAELRLNRFRNQYVQYFPFIVLSSSLTVHELRQERPILWKSIMTVTSPHSTEQVLLSNEMRAIIGKEAFVHGTRNMDFLLAVLVFCSWDRRFCFGKPVLIGLVQLAIAIVSDLGLDKPPLEDPAIRFAYTLKGTSKPPSTSKATTLEERRALLGVFCLSSVGVAMRWTAFLNESLHILETANEFDSDVTLVQLVKLRLICDRTSDLSGPSAYAELDLAAKPPMSFYLSSVQSQLRTFTSNIPTHLSNNTLLLMELYMTELAINEAGLTHAPGAFDGSENLRTECLWNCLNAMKSWIEVFFSIPPAQYLGLSTVMYSNMTRSLIGLYRLSMFEHANWDRTVVRNHIDIMSFLDQCERNLAAVKDVADLDMGGSADTDFFTIMASRVGIIKANWPYAAGSSTTASLTVPSNDDLDLSGFPWGFSDEDWLMNVLMPRSE